MSTVKLISLEELNQYAFADRSYLRIQTTVMPGDLRKKVSELRATKKESEIKKATDIEKQHTVKVRMNMVRVTFEEAFKIIGEAQSLTVGIQAFLRKLGSDKIKKIVKGEEMELKITSDGEEKTVKCKGGIVHLDYTVWANRSGAKKASEPEKKTVQQFKKLDADQQRVALKDILMGTGMSAEDAEKQVNATLGEPKGEAKESK